MSDSMIEDGVLSDSGREYCVLRFVRGGYYIHFDDSGEEHVNVLLGAVCGAGKMYHSTEFWDEDNGRGSPSGLIQAAANEMAVAFAKIQDENRRLREQLEELKLDAVGDGAFAAPFGTNGCEDCDDDE